MKKILFLSFAVLGILSAASCKQEIAGPDGIRTVISASLPSSKTALGDKEGTMWPNYWSAGDQINVNGIDSDALAAEAAGTASAEFSFNGVVGLPYNALYPASALSDYGGDSADLNMPATQNYAEGSYDAAAFLMVGTSNNEYSVNLTPCVSVFHLSLTGSASISKVKLTGSDSAVLSGSFNTDFSSITPVAGGTSNTVELVASNPVALPAEFFICVPAGLSGELTVEVRDSDGGFMVKQANIKAPLASGQLYSPPALEYVATSPGGFEITAENITSSTAVICWADPAPAYTISVYSDSACSTLVDKYEVSAGNACWGGNDPRFCISGLAPGTTYYVQVSSDSASSDVLPVTTEQFEIVEVSSSPASIGDVILAEDFGELRWDCDMIGAGAGWFPTTEAQASFSTVEPGSFQAAATSNEKMLSSQSSAIASSRLAHWAQGAKANIYIHPGYLKLVGSGNVTHIVTPALDNIPDGQLATVEVELTASAYYSASNGTFSTLDAIVAVQAPGEYGELKDNGKNTLDLERNIAPITLVEATEWNTYKVTLSGVAKGARLAFGAEKSVTGNTARMNISDMKVTIKSLAEDLSLVLIDSDAKFQQFVSAVESGNKTLDARVTVSGSTLNLSSSTVNAFASIEDYAGTFDGNGKTISGLTKPLFATLKGTVKDLTLNSTITATDADDVNWGIFAKVLMSDGAVASLDNCTASGSLTFAPATALSSDCQVGGLVGNNRGGSISSCTNNANVTMASNGETNSSQSSVGGVLGRTQKSDAGQGSITSCTNNGTVACNAILDQNAYIGGVLGYQVEKKESISGCVNKGLVKVGSTFSTTKALHLGGVIGMGKGLIESCTNLSQGTVTSEEGSSTGTYLCQGGVVGRMNRDASDISYTGLSNEGTVNVAAAGGSEYRLVGGVVGRCDEGAVITEFTNSGNINYSAVTPEQVFIGGIVASNTFAGNTIDNCHSTGGTLSYTGATASGNLYIGGIVGYSKCAISNCTNAMTVDLGGDFERTSNNFNAAGGIVGSMSQNAPISDCLNTGTIIYSQQLSGSNGYSYLGGVAGRTVGDIIDSSNGGTVMFTGKNDAQNPYIAGLVGDTPNDETVTISGKYSSAPATNYGRIVVNTTAQSKKYVYVGGITGRLRCQLENTTNAGKIDVTSLTCTNLYLGGIVGSNTRAISGNDNLADGDITVSGLTAKSYGYIGGVVGLNSAEVSGDNAGDVVATSGSTSAKSFFIGGVVGRGEGNITSCTNSGTVSNACPVTTKDSYIQVGGVVGYNNGSSVISNCHNTGSVSNSADCNGYVYIGGITSESDAEISDCDNTGDVSNSGNSGNARWISIGGLVGQNSSTIISSSNGTSSANGGTVSNSGTAAEDVNIGGLAGCNNGGTLTNCYNNGEVSNSGNSSEGYNVSVGGLVGWSSANSVYEACHNSGNVTNTGNGSNDNDPGARVAGLVASASGANTLTGSDSEYNYNEGKVFENSSSLIAAVGGICAWANNAAGNFDYCQNLPEGDIEVTGGSYKYLYIGGILASANKTPSFSYTKNAGDIKITGITISEAAYIGGINGGFLANGTQTITGCENTGAITCENSGGNGGNMAAAAIEGTSGKNVMTYIGGIAGVSGKGSAKIGKTFTYCINRGAINVYNQLPTRLGGCFGYGNKNPEYCENHGKIVYYRYDPQNWLNSGAVGGIVGYINIATVSNLTNTGGVQSTGSSPNCYTGGIVGQEGGNMTTMEYCNLGKPGGQIHIVGAHPGSFDSISAGLFVASSTDKEWTFTDCKVITGTKCQGTVITDENMAEAVVGRHHATSTVGLPVLVTEF